MIALSLRGLAQRKLRTALTAVAIVLGVAMLGGTLVTGETTKAAFEHYFTVATSGSDVIVSGKLAVNDPEGGTPAVLDSGLVDRIGRVPGVALAEGSVGDAAQLIGPDGKVLGSPDATGILESRVDERLDGVRLTTGAWPGSGQVAIDRETAAKAGLHVGDTVGVATRRPTEQLRVSGIVRLGDLSTGGTTYAVVDLPTAQRLLARDGVDAVRVIAAPGVTPAALAGRIRAAGLTSTLPLRVETGAQAVDRTLKENAAWLDLLRNGLLAFGAIALFVGAFIIFNTFSITVQQRTRELALLRSIGASRRQVLAAVVLETVLVAVVAAALGILAGIGLAAGLLGLFGALGLSLPTVPLVLTPATLLPGFIAGVAVALVAGLVPAVRATRVAPTAALRDAEPAGSRPGRVSLVLGSVLGIAALVAIATAVLARPGGADARLLLAGGGSLALFLAVAVLAPRLVSPLVRVLGAPLGRVGGGPALLGVENTRRSPGRTAATAGSLMVGVALVAAMSIFAVSIGGGQHGELARAIDADLIVQPNGFGGQLDGGVATAVAKVPGVRVAAPMATAVSSFRGGSRHIAIGVGSSFTDVYRLRWTAGSDAIVRGLGPHDAVVEQTIADAEHLHVGSPFTIVTANGRTAVFTVRGTYADDAYATGYLVSLDAFHATFGSTDDARVLVDLAAGADPSATRAAIGSALTRWQGSELRSESELLRSFDHGVQQTVALVDAMLAISILISLFGIVNTLVLAVVERTRELALLRAIGSSRRQVRRMVRYEAVLTALVGTVLGLAVGAVLALLSVRAIGGYGYRVPVGQLGAIIAGAVVVGIVAAVVPARRASRVDILAGLQHV